MSMKEVELTGGAPWGFRMHGGIDQNQPLRISRVNPGRKASLNGIREGDLISSINGRPTKTMTNAEAHTMLRTAGPSLKLGLNEDREMSPRRRSIGKGAEFKRPADLISRTEPAILQAPVYATIKQSNLQQNRTPPSPMRMNSLPSTFPSTPLVKAAEDQQIKIHPTNPFYTTLPSNSHYTSPTKSRPNGSIYSTLDRSNSMNECKKPEFYTFGYKTPQFKSHDSFSGTQSLSYIDDREPYRYSNKDELKENNYHDKIPRYDELSNGKNLEYQPNFKQSNDKPKNTIKTDCPNAPNDPFDTSFINTDPFERYLKLKSSFKDDPKALNNVNDVKEEMTETSTTTERKISEIEEVKTVKNVIINSNGNDKSPTNSIKIIDNDWPHANTDKIERNVSEKSTLNGSSSPLPNKQIYYEKSERNNHTMNERHNYEENEQNDSEINQGNKYDKNDQMRRSYSASSNQEPTFESHHIVDYNPGT